MKIRNKITLNFVLIFTLTLLMVGVVFNLYSGNIIKKNIYAYLSSSNRARAEHIRTFIQEKEKSADILASASVYRDLLKEPTGSEQYEVIKSKIDKRLTRTLVADNEIHQAFILNKDGKVIASSDKKEEGLDKSKDDYFINGKEKVYFKGIYFSSTIKALAYAVSAPILDDDGSFLGISVLRYSADDFYLVVSSDNGLGETEENFLINRDKFFITPSRFLGNDVILKQKVETENAQNCFEPKEIVYITKNGYKDIAKVESHPHILQSQDYRGVNITGTHSYIPETGWCLITKVDTTQLLAYRASLLLVVFLVCLVALVILILWGFMLAKGITEPLAILSQLASKIRQGNFNIRSGIKTKDEFGELSETFDLMSEAVKQSQTDIEKKVEEQTKEISRKVKDLADQKKAILNILEDVEEEKKRAEGLANDLEKFKLAVDNASDQVVITDAEGIVIYGNQSVAKITGFTPEEAIGKKAGVLWKTPMPKEYYQNMWNIIKTQKKVFVSEIQNKRKNGEPYTAVISVSPVLNKESEVIYFVGIERDITREKEIDKAKTEFVSLASHQLRTPLSSINWYTEMLLAGDAGKINAEQKKYLTEVALGNRRMVDLVDSLLNVSRLDLGTFMIEPVPTNIVDVAQSVLAELKPQISDKKLVVVESYEGDNSEFLADQKLLRIVFQNLLSNAVKYTPAKGNISLKILPVLRGKTLGGKKMTTDSLVLSVADFGIGIPTGQQDKIFSKLFRADNARESETEGTGLGLYIVKSIVDQSNGLVWFESAENRGTTFYVALPLAGMKKKEGTKKLD